MKEYKEGIYRNKFKNHYFNNGMEVIYLNECKLSLLKEILKWLEITSVLDRIEKKNRFCNQKCDDCRKGIRFPEVIEELKGLIKKNN